MGASGYLLTPDGRIAVSYALRAESGTDRSLRSRWPLRVQGRSSSHLPLSLPARV